MITTWSEGVAFTFRTRHKWRTGNGATSSRINCGHVSRIIGDDFVLSDINKAVIRTIEFACEDYGHSDATINRVLAALSTVLNHCVNEEVCDFNVPRIPKRKESQGRPYYFTQEQVEMLCSEENSVGQADLIKFASLTGGRQGEIMKLKVQDIDLKNELVYFGGRPEFNTKNGDWRTVPLHTHLRDMLVMRCDGVPSDVAVFDEWATAERLLRKFKQRVRDVGIEPHYVFHCLRHSFATWHVEAGTPIPVLMDLMGHKNVKTTLRYGKATDKARLEAIASFVG